MVRGGGGGGVAIAAVLAFIALLVVLFLLFGQGLLDNRPTDTLKADVDINLPSGGGGQTK